MNKTFVTCDCCKEHIPKNDVSVIVEKYQTNTIKVMCPKCIETVTKYMERLRCDSEQDNVRRIRKFIEHYSNKSKIVHVSDKSDPVEQMTLKIWFTVIFYCLFSFIALIGVTGTIVLFKGIIPVLSVITVISAWGLLSYKVISGIKQKLNTFVIDTERTYEDFLREDLYNRDMRIWESNTKNHTENKHMYDAMKMVINKNGMGVMKSNSTPFD